MSRLTARKEKPRNKLADASNSEWWKDMAEELPDLIESGESIFGGGGGGCTSSIKQQRSKMAREIETHLTDQDKRQLVSGMEDRVSPNGQDMAYFFYGEDDCKHRNVSKRHKRFLNELPQMLSKRKQSSLPSNVSLSPANIPPVLKYTAIALTVGGAGYYGYNKYMK